MIPEKLSLILSAVPTSAPDAGTSITVMVVIGTLAGLLIIAVNIKKLFWDKARSAPAFATRNEL